MENNQSYFYQNQGFKIGEISPDLSQESEEEMTEKKTKKKVRSEETLAEKLARQTARYQHLNKQVRAVGRIALSSVTREQVTLATQYLNAKDALEKTQKEIDADLAKAKEQDDKIKEKDDRIKELEAKIERLSGGQHRQ